MAQLRRLLFILQNHFPSLAGEVLFTDENDPYLSIELGGWAAVMIAPEPDHPDTYGIVVTHDSGELGSMLKRRSFEATMAFVRAYINSNH